jgi:hypothetical protein
LPSDFEARATDVLSHMPMYMMNIRSLLNTMNLADHLYDCALEFFAAHKNRLEPFDSPGGKMVRLKS